METSLYETLTEYGRQGLVPMHMPGHKRNPSFVMENPYKIDVTEVTGMDDLHHPEGMIRRLMDRVTEEYGSEQSYLLINGSTGGILAAITACCRHGDRIILARNCHKSVYHAIRLLELRPVYLYPEETGGDMENLGIPGIISEQAVERALQVYGDARCVVITSPTYEGIVSPVRQIAAVSERHQVPLIVDEAHGAHFHWHRSFPDTALHEGADLVVESLHKTLPALTQTGVLHARFKRVSRERLEWGLQTFQSSSPSYVLMAGIDQCFAYIGKEGETAFEAYAERLREFAREMECLTRLYLFDSAYKEKSKIVIGTDRAGITGRQLADCLLYQYRIETEMSCGSYCTAMTSVCDEPGNIRWLGKALREIDEGIQAGDTGSISPCTPCGKVDFRYTWHAPARKKYSYEAAACPREKILLEQAEGRTVAEDLIVYPPGIPLLVQGEVFSGEMIRMVQEGTATGHVIYGVHGNTVNVVAEG